MSVPKADDIATSTSRICGNAFSFPGGHSTFYMPKLRPWELVMPYGIISLMVLQGLSFVSTRISPGSHIRIPAQGPKIQGCSVFQFHLIIWFRKHLCTF
jgi:hypothetical protein